eukprot:5192411-Pleurochrysis_carterae.AAC.1
MARLPSSGGTKPEKRLPKSCLKAVVATLVQTRLSWMTDTEEDTEINEGKAKQVEDKLDRAQEKG